jgi:hypothetical protein
LEIGVEWPIATVEGMVVATEGVALPDLDPQTFARPSPLVEYLPR